MPGEKPALPSDVDREIRPLCEAINKLPGVQTVESCFGHGDRPMRIWVKADSFQAISGLSVLTQGCHAPRGWVLKCGDLCSPTPGVFLLEYAHVSEKVAYKQAMRLVRWIQKETKQGGWGVRPLEEAKDDAR